MIKTIRYLPISEHKRSDPTIRFFQLFCRYFFSRRDNRIRLISRRSCLLAVVPRKFTPDLRTFVRVISAPGLSDQIYLIAGEFRQKRRASKEVFN